MKKKALAKTPDEIKPGEYEQFRLLQADQRAFAKASLKVKTEMLVRKILQNGSISKSITLLEGKDVTKNDITNVLQDVPHF